MTDDRPQAKTRDGFVTRLIDNLRAARRALGAAFARITPSTPPIGETGRVDGKPPHPATKDGF